MSVPEPPKSLGQAQKQRISLIKPRKAAALPRGPQNIQRIMRVERVDGPGAVPDGFLGNRNSASEWPPYWALMRIFAPDQNPRMGPFMGWPPFFTYQSGQGNGAGSAVVDFVIYRPGYGGRNVGIRIQTERYHIYVTAAKQYTDQMQRENLERSMDVVDVYEQDYLSDPSGQAIIKQMKAACGLIDAANPLTFGIAMRSSRMNRVG